MLRKNIFKRKQNVYKHSEHNIIWGGKAKELVSILRVKLTQELEETCEVAFY